MQLAQPVLRLPQASAGGARGGGGGGAGVTPSPSGGGVWGLPLSFFKKNLYKALILILETISE